MRKHVSRAIPCHRCGRTRADLRASGHRVGTLYISGNGRRTCTDCLRVLGAALMTRLPIAPGRSRDRT
jgi:hypothetical protein